MPLTEGRQYYRLFSHFPGNETFLIKFNTIFVIQKVM